MIIRAKSGIFKPNLYTVVTNIEEPETFEQAIIDKNWKAAMDEEYNALMRNKTWT